MHVPSPRGIAKSAIRSGVCTTCYQRPPLSETLGPQTPRQCEPTCPVFRYLDALEMIAMDSAGAPGTVEHAMREQVCSTCDLSPTAGDYCAEMEARTCPLSRYATRVLQILEDLQRRGHIKWRPAAWANAAFPQQRRT